MFLLFVYIIQLFKGFLVMKIHISSEAEA